MGKSSIKKLTGGLKRLLFILITLLAASLYWVSLHYYQTIKEGIDFIGRFFGFSLIPMLVYLIIVGWTAKYLPKLLWRRLFLFLGLAVLVMVICGVLALFALGGGFGELIIGSGSFMPILRLVILSYIALLLIFPSLILLASWQMAKALGHSLNYLFSLPIKIKNLFAAQGEEAQLSPEEVNEPIKAQEEGVKSKVQEEGTKVSPTEISLLQPTITSSGWQLPPLEILNPAPEGGWERLKVEDKAKKLEEALSSYGVEGRVVGINIGPTITQFEVEPGWERKFKEIKEQDKDGNIRVKKVEISRTRVKVERIQSLANNLALALAVPSVRIEAPIPGKSAVGIEVPNTAANVVTLRSVIETTEFQKLLAKTKLALALGKGAGGEAVVIDLASMPHLLIAGATGSGKTVCLNSFVCCLIMHNSPEDIKLVLIDPKRVEFVQYSPIPHLMMPVVEIDGVRGALSKLEQEMDLRYKLFSQAGVRNIQSYNKSVNKPLPYIIVVVDELADLMINIGGEVEEKLCRLAQLARATGIHLIVATQRPSVDVITGLIKANFPSRISFAVASQVDSRTILDMAGAEKLLGKGDMLYLSQDSSRPKRVQGCFISDNEIQQLVGFWARQRKEPQPPFREQAVGQEDPLLSAARRLALEHKRLSPSFLQRRLQIGYLRAVKLIEELEKEGAIKKES